MASAAALTWDGTQSLPYTPRVQAYIHRMSSNSCRHQLSYLTTVKPICQGHQQQCVSGQTCPSRETTFARRNVEKERRGLVLTTRKPALALRRRQIGPPMRTLPQALSFGLTPGSHLSHTWTCRCNWTVMPYCRRAQSPWRGRRACQKQHAAVPSCISQQLFSINLTCTHQTPRRARQSPRCRATSRGKRRPECHSASSHRRRPGPTLR